MRGNKIEVRFDSGIKGVSAQWVKSIVDGALVEEEKSGLCVSIFLTDDKRIRKINQQHLSHDWATDVISFGFDKKTLTSKEAGMLGDVVVSVEMAKNMSEELAIPFREELARYLVHGTLHLLGYDDKKASDKTRMHARQERIVKKAC